VPKPTISIVIPVYNEESYLAACLEAIEQQSVAPLEVIVVDNNSTDRTAAVARSFPFVTLLHEKRQGVVYARTAGFDAVKGDVIGRIDADTIIAPNWVETLESIFADTTAGAISGSVGYYDAPLSDFFGAVDSTFRSYFAWSLGHEYALQGANLAFRRSYWVLAREKMCNRKNMHEDFDLAIHLREIGCTTAYEPSLRAKVAFRQAAAEPKQFCNYALLSPGTYAQHGIRRRFVMHPVIAIALVFYPLLHMLYLGYDRKTASFSFKKLLLGDFSTRVNPATFVD